MKRYNLFQIMKDAHRFYRSNSRMGRTFGECLKLAWRWAKDTIKFAEEREAKKQALLANQKPVKCTSYNTRVRDKDCVKNRVKRAKIVRFTLC